MKTFRVDLRTGVVVSTVKHTSAVSLIELLSVTTCIEISGCSSDLRSFRVSRVRLAAQDLLDAIQQSNRIPIAGGIVSSSSTAWRVMTSSEFISGTSSRRTTLRQYKACPSSRCSARTPGLRQCSSFRLLYPRL